MDSFDRLLCLEQPIDCSETDAEVQRTTLCGQESQRPPSVDGGSLARDRCTTVRYNRRPVVCRTLNGDDDRRVLDNLLSYDIKCRQHYDGPVDYFEMKTQPDIQPYMRDIVTAWMLEVCEAERCADEVFPLSVAYLDKFLATPSPSSSSSSWLPLRRSQLQLVAATCMFIASKYRDTLVIPATQLVMYTDFSITLDQLIDFEFVVLQTINWELSLPTPHDYFEHLLKRLPVMTSQQHISIRRHAHTFAAMCITDTLFLRCPTSTMAVACISAAAHGLMDRQWCYNNQFNIVDKLAEITSIDVDSIKTWQNKIEQLLNNYHISSSSLSSSRQEQEQQLVAVTSPSSADIEDKTPPGGCFQRQLSTPADVQEIALTD